MKFPVCCRKDGEGELEREEGRESGWTETEELVSIHQRVHRFAFLP